MRTLGQGGMPLYCLCFLPSPHTFFQILFLSHSHPPSPTPLQQSQRDSWEGGVFPSPHSLGKPTIYQLVHPAAAHALPLTWQRECSSIQGGCCNGQPATMCLSRQCFSRAFCGGGETSPALFLQHSHFSAKLRGLPNLQKIFPSFYMASIHRY